MTGAFAHKVFTCVAAAGVLASLSTPPTAAPSSKCRLNLQSDYVSPADRSISDEKRQEVRNRVLIDALDDVDIVFRGRLTKRRYLSDVNETFIPTILEVYSNVTVLKGSMPETAKDGQVFIIREKLCNGGCRIHTLPEFDDGGDEIEHVILALNNTLENPEKARDRWSKEVVYQGRIDALLGPCDPHQVNQKSALALITAPDEMERLKRTYPPRTQNDKLRDDLSFLKKMTGRP